MRELTRREALAGATTLGAVAVAGCVSSGGDDDTGNTDETGADDSQDSGDIGEDNDEPEQDNGEESQEPQESPLELVGTEVTATNGSCGSGDQVEASVTDGDVTLSGKIPASNPCHAAVIEDQSMEDGSVSMTVGLESASGDTEVCPSCLGVIDYEAVLEFSEDLSDLSALDSLTVEHGGRSEETHTIEEAGVVSGRRSRGGDGSGDDAVDRAVLADSIATTDRGCTSNLPPSDEPERAEADDETEVTQEDNTVTVQGSVAARTPCHEAVLDQVSYDSGVLSLTVATESNLETGEVCMECLAEIKYEATVDVAEDVTVEEVSVTHIQPGSL